MWIKDEIGDRYEYESACCGSVQFRTNGPQGGDSGHGGYLEITFDTENCSTSLEANVNGQAYDNVETVTLKFRGDCEMKAALECLEFLSSKLRAISGD